MEFSRKQIEDLLVQIYSGEISVRNLPVNLVYAIYEYLDSAVDIGLSAYNVAASFQTELSTNVFLFSSAKTFNFVLSTRGLIYEEGRIIPLNEFKKRAKQNYELYNDTWLEAEYNTTLGTAQNAGHWHTMTNNRGAGQYLKYDAILDMQTSDICRPLDGIVRHMDDPFWNTHMSPNHYNCRCTVQQVQGPETNSTEVIEATQKVDPLMNEVFKTNAGKTKKIFDENHPYFQVANEYKALARSNFNVPIPKTLLQDGQ